jgi:hypothetical protein
MCVHYCGSSVCIYNSAHTSAYILTSTHLHMHSCAYTHTYIPPSQHFQEIETLGSCTQEPQPEGYRLDRSREGAQSHTPQTCTSERGDICHSFCKGAELAARERDWIWAEVRWLGCPAGGRFPVAVVQTPPPAPSLGILSGASLSLVLSDRGRGSLGCTQETRSGQIQLHPRGVFTGCTVLSCLCVLQQALGNPKAPRKDTLVAKSLLSPWHFPKRESS